MKTLHKWAIAATMAGTMTTTLSMAQEAPTDHMLIKRSGSQESFVGPEQYFTGQAKVDMLTTPHEPSRLSAAYVHFEPGARSAWHTHPVGQTLIVTEGVGWVQEEGGKKIEIKPGDVVWTPPGVKHWHGASADHAMTHIAVQEVEDGKNVEWMEKVSDDQYQD